MSVAFEIEVVPTGTVGAEMRGAPDTGCRMTMGCGVPTDVRGSSEGAMPLRT